MRLLLVTDEYLPHLGGVPRVILETSRRLQARGHQVTVLTFERDPGLLSQKQVAGVTVRRLHLEGRWSIYLRALASSRQALREHVQDDAYDVVHFHLPMIGLGGLLGMKADTIPRLYTFYGPWHREMEVELRARVLHPAVRSFYTLYLRLLCRSLKGWQGYVMHNCDRVVVLSEHSRQETARYFPAISQSRITQIPGGVDVEHFCPTASQAEVRARLNLPVQSTILLTVRRLVPRMGLENLLCAFAEIGADQDDLMLLVGGQGRLEGALHALVEQLGLAKRVRFAGYIPEEELPAYYQAASLFVLPTQELEGFGLITLEALASGLPVVGTPVGAIPEVLGRFDDRFLTAGTDVTALTAGMRRGLGLVRQEGLALVQRCRQFAVQNYDWERIVDRYEALYAELVAERAADV